MITDWTVVRPDKPVFHANDGALVHARAFAHWVEEAIQVNDMTKAWPMEMEMMVQLGRLWAEIAIAEAHDV